MAKELYLYGGIYNESAQNLISQMEEYKSEKISIRTNTQGGSVFAGWGIVAKMQEIGGITIKADGNVASMGAFMLLFAENVEALDVTTIDFHRADAYVSSPEDQAWLDARNADFRKKMEAKIGADKWLMVTSISLDKLFDPQSRITVSLTAKQAKQLGIVTKITKLSTSEIQAYNERVLGLVAESVPVSTPTIPKTKIMDINTLKAEHPALYDSIVALGVNKERDRVGALATFISIDSEAVTTAIKEGSELTQTFIAEMTMKGINANTLQKIEAANTKPVETTAVAVDPAGKELSAEEKAKADFEAELDRKLGLTK
jgi:ATP-dependent protease ClpP protease subunit